MLSLLLAAAIAATPAPATAKAARDERVAVCALRYIETTKAYLDQVEPTPFLDIYTVRKGMDDAAKTALVAECDMFDQGADMVTRLTSKPTVVEAPGLGDPSGHDLGSNWPHNTSLTR